jgi:hypothetical protein
LSKGFWAFFLPPFLPFERRLFLPIVIAANFAPNNYLSTTILIVFPLLSCLAILKHESSEIHPCKSIAATMHLFMHRYNVHCHLAASHLHAITANIHSACFASSGLCCLQSARTRDLLLCASVYIGLRRVDDACCQWRCAFVSAGLATSRALPAA